MLIPSNFYLLRVPHFSISKLYALNKNIEQQDIFSIKSIFRDEIFLNAVFLSSRYFYEVAIAWLANDKIIYNTEDKILNSLYKYYSRICTRCTPYGLFAGFGTGSISKKKSQIIFADNYFQPIFRIDLLFLKKIKEKLLQNQREGILYYPNNSLYEIGKNLRYIEWDKEYNYEISEIENNSVLNKIIDISKEGVTKTEIVTYVNHFFLEIEKNEIVAFVNSLIDNKILIDSLPPYLTSLDDPLMELHDSLNKIGINTDVLKPIIEFQKQHTPIYFKEMSDYCNGIIGEDKGQFFQVDLKLNLDLNNINISIIEHLSKVANELSFLTGNESQERVTEFYRKFYKKFEGREIPLSHALDPQIGVGYGLQTSGNVEETPLVNDIYFTYKNENEKVTIPSIIKIIIEKYIDCFDSKSSKIIHLNENDIRDASSDKPANNLQNDYYFFGNLIAKSAEDLDNLAFKFLPKSPFPSPFANNILSRFAYHDEELLEKMKVNTQKNNDIIHAEIIHHPSDRVGNILLRPNLYDFEIPYVTESKGDKIKIEVSDILVRIDGGRIILKSKSQNREIKPHLSSAYNYALNQLSVIRFLGDLQYHSKFNGFSWDWSVFKNKDYLPRVEYKNIILSEARWKIAKMKDHTFTDFKNLIDTINLPRYCNFKEGDNVLLIDTENEICLRILYTKAKKTAIYLYESFVENFVTKGEEKYNAEFIFPLNVKNKIEESSQLNIIEQKIDTNKRDFYLGSEWTYFKIYCSHKLGDKVLQDVIAPFIDKFKEKDMNFEWFYIRYEDPDPHIRFRIHSPFTEEILNILNKYLNPLLAEDIIFSIQMDSYRREVERYGKKNIELSEKLFYFDSNATLKFINMMDREGYDESIRWKIGVTSLDIMLDDFEISIKDRIILFENLYKNFLPEFVDVSNKQYSKLFKGSLDKQHRKYKEFLDSILRKKDYQEIHAFTIPYSERSKYIREIADVIRQNTKDNNDLLNLLQSYVHMTLNRLFFTKARMYELIIYYLMYQTYNSILNRNDEQ